MRVQSRRRDHLEDLIEQRLHVGARFVRFARSPTLARTCVGDREVEREFFGAEVGEQVKDLAKDLVRTRFLAVHLVDDDQGQQALCKCLFNHESRLRHRAFKRINDKQDAIGHRKHALDLSTEVGVTRSIDQVDVHAAPFNGGVLRQNGDAPLTLKSVGV